MKHFLLYLCLAATLGATEARNPSEMGDEPVIIDIQDGHQPNIGNRGSVVVPINGYVEPSNGMVVLEFTQPCGTVQISFNNLSDGSYYSTSVNGSGSVVIPLTLTSGSWTVKFTLPNGNVYIGEFII